MNKELNADVERLRAKMFRSLFLYAGTGFDPAICNQDEGMKEVQKFWYDADKKENDDLLLFYSELLSGNGHAYARNICSHMSILREYPIICNHLVLSVYS